MPQKVEAVITARRPGVSHMLSSPELGLPPDLLRDPPEGIQRVFVDLVDGMVANAVDARIAEGVVPLLSGSPTRPRAGRRGDEGDPTAGGIEIGGSPGLREVAA